MKQLILMIIVIGLVLFGACAPTAAPPAPTPAPAPAPAPTPPPTPAPAPAPAPTPAPAPAPAPTPPPAPLVETKTYTNSEYSFLVEYPADWDVLEDYQGTTVVFMGPLLEGIYMVNISIIAERLSSSMLPMTLKDYVTSGEMIDKRSIPDYEKLDEYSDTVSGLPATVQIISGTLEVGAEKLVLKDGVARFIKDDVGYIITYDILEEYHDEYFYAFDLAISSFRFE